MLDKNLNNQKATSYNFKLLNKIDGIYIGKENENSRYIYIDMEKEFNEISKIFNSKSNINNFNKCFNPFHLTTNRVRISY